MPRRQKKAPPPHSHPALVDSLAEELRHPSRSPGPGLPNICEEEQPRGNYLHVTVIWDQWGGVATEERGAVILDAYEKAGLQDELRRITLALGLTAEEAKRLKIGD